MNPTVLANVDPEWAWSPFEPEAARPWTYRLAAHLHRRAGFGASAEDLAAAVALSPAEAVDALFARSEPETYRSEMSDLGRATIATGDVAKLPAWWCYRILSTPHPLLEKTTLFWHGHFATSAAKVTDPELMAKHFELLHRHALGHFGDLVAEMSRDPAMLLWLDSATNRKAHPNENYAREVMELFCLGEGHYSETDIRELARCFTGWEVKQKAFRFNRYQHDHGSKTVLGESGEFGGDEGVQIVLRRDDCPRFVIRKLVRYFLFDEPQVSDDLIAPLARQFRDDGLQVAGVLRRMLGSNLFFSPHAVARQVRSPVDFAVGLLRSLEGTTNNYVLADGLASLGQRLFYPPNVKGWDGGRHWINSTTLLARANLVRKLLDLSETRFGRAGLADLCDKYGVDSGDEIVDWWQQLLFAVTPPADVLRQVAQRIDSGAGDREHRLRDSLHVLLTQPEFQLG